jgi:AcrR family transcriptional regulator
MTTHDRHAKDTRQRLLDSSREVFSRKGYREATIAEICEGADANIAAVNYHFGDKESLYVETWRHAFQMSIATHPPDGGVGDDAPPEARLRARIGALLHRIADSKSCEFTIVRTELANPTGLLDDAMHDAITPLREKMAGLVRELLGPRASAEHVQFCQMSIMSQCLHVMLHLRFGVAGATRGLPRVRSIDAYADHVTAFSLAGLRAVREAWESAPAELADTAGGDDAPSA